MGHSVTLYTEFYLPNIVLLHGTCVYALKCVFTCPAKKNTAFLGLVVANLAISRQHCIIIILSDFRQSRTVNVGSAVRNSFSTASKVWHLLSRFS